MYGYWASIGLMVENTNVKLRGQSRSAVFAPLTGFVIAAMAYLLSEVFEALVRPSVHDRHATSSS